MRRFNLQQYRNTQGAVLFVGLMFLLIMTFFGLSAMNATSINARLTQNLQDTLTAFNAAESALGVGEEWVQNQGTPPQGVTTCNTPPCDVWDEGALANVHLLGSSWWTTQARPFPSAHGLVAAQPLFVVEEFRFVAYDLSPDTYSKGQGYYLYRVTALGTGETLDASTIVQSIYATQFN